MALTLVVSSEVNVVGRDSSPNMGENGRDVEIVALP
jgi:hypothetical protein